MTSSTNPVVVTLIGGPTALIEVGGLRILTDPAFNAAGDYPSGTRTLTKTADPAIAADQLGRVDVVLLSHDQHADNLDDAGRALLPSAGQVITTAAAAERLGGNAVALSPWHHIDVELPSGATMRVIGTPAQHGPDGTEGATGPVIGFVLVSDETPTVYVSGDNASLRIVEEVAHHLGPIDVAVLNAGAARTPVLNAYLTLTSEQAARATRVLDPRSTVVLHSEGWAHFTNDQASVDAAFSHAGLRDKLAIPAPGETVTV